ncbi:hypothetical protein CYMTET_29647 [Cymbomonas tetramitiformis]|uniref:Apple domain-containing protein n=1 Tax=Cymbomonas tetramitiformis TaxID=36881 RepID=A0AAE0FKM6_9CHLO|nr:hypothetical protein CYMTET_29647 [Cymbomonas tetramitiformis]
MKFLSQLGFCALILLPFTVATGGNGHYSTCTHMRGRQGEYLDRQNVGTECSSNEPMTGFGLENDGCSGEDMRYAYSCASATDISVSGTSERTSGCQALRQKDVEYLDRQDPFCESGEAMVQFIVSGCDGENMEYKYTCADLGKQMESTTHYSSCQQERGEKLEYLDRLNIQCPEGEWLNGFVLEQGDCGGNDMRYRFKCIKPVGFEDYPGTVCKQWTESEDDKDNGVYERYKKVESLADCQAKCLEDSNTCHGVEYNALKQKCDIFTQTISSFKYVKDTEKEITCSVNREVSLIPLTKYRKNGKEGKEYEYPKHLLEVSFKKLSHPGKCTVNGGQDPRFTYFGGDGGECEAKCLDDETCYGYSVSSSNNCLIWQEGVIDNTPGDQWGGAHCFSKMTGDIAYSGASSSATIASTPFVFAVVGSAIAAAVLGMVAYRRRQPNVPDREGEVKVVYGAVEEESSDV